MVEITHVLFDMDGLIFDTEAIYTSALNSITQRYGKEYPYEIKRRVMGMKQLEATVYMIEQLHLPLTSLEMIMLIERELPSSRWHDVKLLPGVERLVLHLADCGIPMAVATGSEQSEFQAKIYRYADLWKHFSHTVISGCDPEVTRGKPAPDVFLTAARRFDPKPASASNVLVFEDSLNGVMAALSAGMHVVWIPDPREPPGNPDIDLLPDQWPTGVKRLSSMTEFRPEEYELPPFRE